MGNKLVFIGKNLEPEVLEKDFAQCLDTPENAEKIKAIEATKKLERMGQMLMGAAQRDDTPALMQLLKANVNVNHRNPMGQTPLHIASMWGRCMAVKLLLGFNADINAQNSPQLGSATPLHMAAMGRGKPDVRAQAAKLLVEAGANLALANDQGLLPWQMVSEEDAAAP